MSMDKVFVLPGLNVADPFSCGELIWGISVLR